MRRRVIKQMNVMEIIMADLDQVMELMMADLNQVMEVMMEDLDQVMEVMVRSVKISKMTVKVN